MLLTSPKLVKSDSRRLNDYTNTYYVVWPSLSLIW